MPEDLKETLFYDYKLDQLMLDYHKIRIKLPNSIAVDSNFKKAFTLY